jgi:2-polyprenyl-6-methoxyphenol hydroxylase-like FAD-dependent oxidoreductase
VALLGDAAFVARPHVIAGVTKAALDAQVLADALATDANFEAALAAYECERLSFGGKIVAHARHLGAHLETHDKPGQALRERETGPRPDIILREYGAPHLLRDPIPANA